MKNTMNTNPNPTQVPQEYLDREANIVFEGEYKGIKYHITENDYERGEISTTMESAHRFMEDKMILLEILNKHYKKTGAGVPSFADKYMWDEVQMPAKSSKVGRNEPCPCGSGTKSKKCCK